MHTITEGFNVLAEACPDMTLRQAAILFHCAVTTLDRDRQVRELAIHFNWFRPVISRAGLKMSNDGLIKRSQIPGDRRTSVFTVTDAGHRLIQSVLGEPAKPEKASPKRRRGLR
jgi:DNA-binding MarR family transcriptional regulator